ncbi:hypothetical protein ACE1TI_17920 [Alteribacillus sp. JSM 102045]|uniref:hypothetical protein n=1 Tax=Alteribacillus sp. JSM 102045 TaxID=1562101 RepID=UPI0035C14BC0
MKHKQWVWILYIPLILFLVGMFFVEMALYILPPEQGGMSYWLRFKNIWDSSISFYVSFLFYLIFGYKREQNTC